MITRWAVLGLLVLLDALLWRAPAARLVIHPVAPPLTRIQALGDAQLGKTVPTPPGALRFGLERALAKIGTPEQRARAQFAPPNGQAQARSQRARLLIQGDAIAIAGILGEARVEQIIARKEDLSAWYGEGRIWAEVAAGR